MHTLSRSVRAYVRVCVRLRARARVYDNVRACVRVTKVPAVPAYYRHW